ncbi:MAG: SRPBCC domain-containing protein, partial [Sphingomonas sp.]
MRPAAGSSISLGEGTPPSIVYRAWSQPELFQRWWMPKSVTGVSLVSCDMDVRT